MSGPGLLPLRSGALLLSALPRTSTPVTSRHKTARALCVAASTIQLGDILSGSFRVAPAHGPQDGKRGFCLSDICLPGQSTVMRLSKLPAQAVLVIGLEG